MDNPFYQSLTNEDIQVRIDAIKGLAAFAAQIGPQRTLDELLPTLGVLCLLDDEDEVLLPLAIELGKFLPLVGGEANVQRILVILEGLSKSEETSVCQKAAASLSGIGAELSEEAFETHFVSLVARLAASEYFPPRVSSCSLFTDALKRCSQTSKKNLLDLYVNLCRDETPMVRRAAATNLKHILPLLTSDVILSQFIEVYHALSADPQDSVRFLIVEVASALASSLRAQNLGEKAWELVQPVVLACAEDKSWRVRYTVANCFVSIANGLGPDAKKLVYLFVNLLRDSEAEVRTAAAGKISGVSALLETQEVIKSILPCIAELVTDDSEQVRSALASDVLLLAPIFGNEGTSQHLLDIFLQLLRDDVPDVRLNIISKLDQVTKVIGLDKLSEHLIPAIIELAEDRQWRIRLSVIKYIPPLAKQLNVDFFSDKLGNLCYSWLVDTVSAIRKASIDNLKELIAVFGEDFAVGTILPKIVELSTKTNYLHRMTVLLFISQVSPALSDAVVINSILPLTVTLAKDPVANIRFRAVAALETLFSRFPADIKENVVRPVLDAANTDKDIDVRLYAAQALKAL
eukprot:TRINITY_DN258_c0_g1_i1.p1 TRINITY_DN258_c0_g1~~TRINITY_DN258_c0_g1_i1.p1  ORF type:complete len:576 (-),score=136.13 TRINITY_DN258_c0_g1_i1:89-1816(-)